MRSPVWLSFTATWLVVLTGMLTNVVTGDDLPDFLKPLDPWKWQLWIAGAVALMLVDLKRNPQVKVRPFGGSKPTPRDRARASRRSRHHVDSVLAETFTVIEPLDLAMRTGDADLPDQSLLTAFDWDESLLVLGVAGSGKSTELLRLASTLLDRADENAPIPLVLSLGGWGRRRRRQRLRDLLRRQASGSGAEPQPLLDWLLNQARRRYGVEPDIVRAWMGDRSVVLILDGLDEIQPELRARAVKAVNDLIGAGVPPPLVVSCRDTEYASLPTPLLLRRTALVEPLTAQQVEEVLDGHPLLADEEFRALLTAPLWLRIVEQVSVRLDTRLGLVQVREQLLDAYLTELLDRRDAADRATVLRTVSLLTRVASYTADPERIDPGTLGGVRTIDLPELTLAIRSWVVPTGVAAASATGIVLPVTLLCGPITGLVTALLNVVVVMSALGSLNNSPAGYVVDPVAVRRWRALAGQLAGLVLGGALGVASSFGAHALANASFGTRVAVIVLPVVASAYLFAEQRSWFVRVASVVVAGLVAYWLAVWFTANAPEFTAGWMIGMLGGGACVGIAAISSPLPEGSASRHLYESRTARRSVPVAIVLGLVTVGVIVAVAAPASRPFVIGPIGGILCAGTFGVSAPAAIGAFTGWLLDMLSAGIVFRWSGLLPFRLRRFLRASARRGLIVRHDDGYRFLHPVLRQHIGRIDVFDGRVPTPSNADERDRALGRVREYLAHRTPDLPYRCAQSLHSFNANGDLLRYLGPDAAVSAFTDSENRLLFLGPPGSGSTTLLLELANELAERAASIPVLLDLGTLPNWSGHKGIVRPLTAWLAHQLGERYGIGEETALRWLHEGQLTILLDGLNKMGSRDAAWVSGMLEEFLDAYPHLAVAVAGRPGPIDPPAQLAQVRIDPLSRDEAGRALGEHADPLLRQRLQWVGQLGPAAAARTVESYVDNKLRGLPALARRWLRHLASSTELTPYTGHALAEGIVLPALVLAAGLTPWLNPVTGLAAGVVVALVVWPALPGLVAERVVRRLLGAAAGLGLGFLIGFAAVELAVVTDRLLSEVPVLGQMGPALVPGMLIGISSIALEERHRWRFDVFVFLTVSLDAMLATGHQWPSFWGIVVGMSIGYAEGWLFTAAVADIRRLHGLVAVWVGVRPWRHERFVQELVARGLVVVTPTGPEVSDPIVAAAVRTA